MGTWGPGLFSDDIASDVREDYRELLGDGFEGPAATDELLKSWKADLSDPDVAAVFWLALADTQWRVGRLEERVKAAALEVMDEGSDLRRWEEETQLRAKRAAVLMKLRHLLETQPPAAKRIPKKFRSTCDWAVGEVIAYRLHSGRIVLFRVVEHHSDRGGTSPVCEVLDYLGTSVPEPRTIAAAHPRLSVHSFARDGGSTILLGSTSARELPLDRIIRTGVVIAPKRSKGHWLGPVVVLWRHVDERLRELFGLS